MVEPLFEGHRETCYFCHNSWGKCTCASPGPENREAPGFLWNEMWINEPNVSECTRYFVDPVVYYGEAYLNSPFVKKGA